MSEVEGPGDAPVQARAYEKYCSECGGVIPRQAMTCDHCGAKLGKPVSKVVLLLVTFFLGGIGGHKFYLGQTGWGVVYLLFFWTYIPSLVALIEFLIYIFTPTERLNEKYSAHGGVVAVMLAIFAVMVVGILAAVALPAYQDYRNAAEKAQLQAK